MSSITSKVKNHLAPIIKLQIRKERALKIEIFKMQNELNARKAGLARLARGVQEMARSSLPFSY